MPAFKSIIFEDRPRSYLQQHKDNFLSFKEKKFNLPMEV